MPNLTSVTKYFPVNSETYQSTLSGSIGPLATTVGAVSTSPYLDGDTVALTVDAGTVKQATFTGQKSGSSYINCVWTEGNLAVSHDGGAPIEDYDSATHTGLISKGIRQFANDDATLKTAAVKAALGVTGDPTGGWSILNAGTPPTLASGANKGNKEFDLTFSSVDLTPVLSPGMRLKFDRTGTTPTQCTDLESSSSQYWSKTSPTGFAFTDDFTVEAWIKLESYTGVNQTIVSRFDGTNGFIFNLDTSGRVRIFGTGRDYRSYQSIPLNQWVHVAANLDMSGGSANIYINGALVANQLVGGAATSFTQAGNLQVGAANSTELFDGEIAQVRVWSAIRTATQIRDNMAIQTVGNESGLVADFKFNGNANDSTSNANNLTASGGATATTTDNPFKTTEYALVTSVTYSSPNTTAKVHTGDTNTIPNMTLQNPYYSTQQNPYNWPGIKWRWYVPIMTTIQKTTLAAIDGLTSTFTAPAGTRNAKIKLWTHGLYRVASTSNVFMHVWDGAVSSGTKITEAPGYTNGGISSAIAEASVTLTGGSKTYTAGLENGGAGTANFEGNPVFPGFLLIEIDD